MKWRWHVFALVPVANLLLAIPSATAEDAIGGDMVVTKDMKPWEGCGECHDLDGVAPNGHFPNLAGQKPAYFRKQMVDFRDDKRGNDHGQMGASSRDFTGSVLDEIIGYFAGLEPPPPRPVGGIAPALVDRARMIVEQGSRPDRIPPCVNCHGAEPKHFPDAPRLEAQQAAYLAKELQDFKSGTRANDPEGAMRKVARRLSDADIEALSAYFAGLPRPAGNH